MNLFVGNMNYDTSEDALRAQFEEFGEVESVRVITDRETGRPRGFAFVEMPNQEEAQAAMEAMDGKEVDGRALKCNEARPKRERGDFGGRGGGGGGGGRRDRW